MELKFQEGGNKYTSKCSRPAMEGLCGHIFILHFGQEIYSVIYISASNQLVNKIILQMYNTVNWALTEKILILYFEY